MAINSVKVTKEKDQGIEILIIEPHITQPYTNSQDLTIIINQTLDSPSEHVNWISTTSNKYQHAQHPKRLHNSIKG